MSVVPCHIRKFDAKADVCDHKTVTFHVNQVPSLALMRGHG
jgi:hypothetical protein